MVFGGSSLFEHDRGYVCEYDKGIRIGIVENEECEAFLHSDQAYAMHCMSTRNTRLDLNVTTAISIWLVVIS